MHRLQLLSIIGLALCTIASAQTATTDSQTLQVLLGEVRQLRQELKGTMVTIQRGQILIYRAQAQQSVVDRDTQRLDDARAKVAETQANLRSTTSALQRWNDTRSNASTDAARKTAEDNVATFQARVDGLTAEGQERQSHVSDCELQLHGDQAKLSELQDELDQIDRALKSQ
jgi:chromosome segregation ATPase